MCWQFRNHQVAILVLLRGTKLLEDCFDGLVIGNRFLVRAKSAAFFLIWRQFSQSSGREPTELQITFRLLEGLSAGPRLRRVPCCRRIREGKKLVDNVHLNVIVTFK
jgi:hypothetical protein